MAAIVDYLGDDLESDGREFVPTAELTEALGTEAKAFALEMAELGCRPTRYRAPTDDGGTRQVGSAAQHHHGSM